MVITVCLEGYPGTGRRYGRPCRDSILYEDRFILQVLYKECILSCYLSIIDKKSEVVEKSPPVHENQELIELLELEKSLVYFTTSLRSNEVVLEN